MSSCSTPSCAEYVSWHHRRADAAAAQNDAPLGACIAHGRADGFGELGIIDRILAIGADVEDLAVLRRQERLDRFFQLEPGMIGTDGDAHAHLVLRSGPAKAGHYERTS